MRVEIQDAERNPLPGFELDSMDELYGDELNAEIQWKSGSDLTRLKKAPVRFRFVIQDADLFAVQIAPADHRSASSAPLRTHNDNIAIGNEK